MENAYVKTVGSSAKRVEGLGETVVEKLLSVGMEDLGVYREHYIVAGDLNSSSVTAMFSSIPNHAQPLSVNLMSNTILQTLAGNQNYKIEVATHPLESGLTMLLEPANPNPTFSTVVPILFGVLLPIGLALFAASYIVFPVEEKLCKVRFIILMSCNLILDINCVNISA